MREPNTYAAVDPVPAPLRERVPLPEPVRHLCDALLVVLGPYVILGLAIGWLWLNFAVFDAAFRWLGVK